MKTMKTIATAAKTNTIAAFNLNSNQDALMEMMAQMQTQMNAQNELIAQLTAAKAAAPAVPAVEAPKVSNMAAKEAVANAWITRNCKKAVGVTAKAVEVTGNTVATGLGYTQVYAAPVAAKATAQTLVGVEKTANYVGSKTGSWATGLSTWAKNNTPGANAPAMTTVAANGNVTITLTAEKAAKLAELIEMLG